MKCGKKALNLQKIRETNFRIKINRFHRKFVKLAVLKKRGNQKKKIIDFTENS